MRSTAFALLLLPGVTGCIDLAAPNIPNRGGPAVFIVTLRQIPGTPFDVSGSFNPGRDSIGVPHPVLSPLIVAGAVVPLGPPTAQRTFNIAAQLAVPSDSVGPFEVQPPIVLQAAQPPLFRWYGMKKLDPDTVKVDSLGDATLHVKSSFTGPPITPSPGRQWFLELRGDAGSIHISGDGQPPDTLRIPSQFIPHAAFKNVFVTLIYFQSSTIVSPPDYIASVTLDVRAEWVVRTR